MTFDRISLRIETGAVLLVLLGFVAALRAGEITLLPPRGQTGATKTLSFPPDRWTGTLELEPDSGVGWDPRGVRLPGEWEHLAAARGDVRVPKDRNIRLRVSLAIDAREAGRLQRQNPQAYQHNIADRVRERPSDLSGLSQLDPNDLFWLSVGSPMLRRTGVDPAIFAPISRLTGLRVLSLEGTGMTDAGLECLRPLRSLKALELTQFPVGPRGLAVLRDLPALEYLDIGTAVTDAGLKEVAGVSSLRWLRITQGNFWGPGLAELARLPHLERLCIQGVVSDRHIQCLEGVTHLKGLALWYVGDALTDASLASIAKLESLEDLHIVMSSPKFTPAGVAHLRNLKRLKTVDFGELTWPGRSGEQYGDEVARQLAGIPTLESVQGLHYLSADGVKMLSTLPNLKCLGIGLKDTRQGYHGPTGLGCLAGLTSLEKLDISSGDPLPDADLAALESLSGLKTLMIWGRNMPGRGVSDRGMASIGRLRQLGHLTLMIPVTRSGLNQLNGLSKLQQLQVTALWEAGETAGAAEATLDLSGLRNVKDLHLTGVPLHADDLAFLRRLPSLEKLMLQPPSPLRGESLRHLRDLPQLDHLFLHNLAGCSAADMTHLNNLPRLRFLRATGDITDDALASLNGSSLETLEVNTDAPIRRETMADLAARLPSIEYIHVSNMPPHLARRSSPSKDTQAGPPRTSDQAPANVRDGRR